MSFTVDSTRLEKALRDTASVSSKPLMDVLMQQGKLLTQDAMKYTPPVEFKEGQAVTKQPWGQQRKLGVNAVARDMKRLFQPLDSLRVFQASNLKLKKELRDLRTAKRYDQLGELLVKLRILKTKPKIIDRATKEIHTANRDRRGRVPKGRETLFVDDAASLRALVKYEQSQVGKAKSGWMKAARALGVKGIPGWIANLVAPGIYQPETTRNGMFITIGNAVDYVQEFGAEKKIMQLAVNARAGAMERAFTNYIQGNARRNGL